MTRTENTSNTPMVFDIPSKLFAPRAAALLVELPCARRVEVGQREAFSEGMTVFDQRCVSTRAGVVQQFLKSDN